MQFTVPQFIGREPKIVGPLTFRQFGYLGMAGLVVFILYFALPFPVFMFLTVILVGGAALLAFLKIGGRSLPIVLQNSLTFLASSKIYLWKKKKIPPKFIELSQKPEAKELTDSTSLKIAERSRLKKLSNEIETGKK
ncbi:PrgI family protein [Patescibacteria group bacterium]